MDNGPELIASLMEEWSQINGIEFIYIQHSARQADSIILEIEYPSVRKLKLYRQVEAYWIKSIL